MSGSIHQTTITEFNVDPLPYRYMSLISASSLPANGIERPTKPIILTGYEFPSGLCKRSAARQFLRSALCQQSMAGRVFYLASFFCSMTTMTGNPHAANALTTNSRFRFCVVNPWSGSNKDDRKKAKVVIRNIMAVCSEEKLARCSSSGY